MSAESNLLERDRIAAVDALAGQTTEEALGALLDAARDDSWRVRERAVRYLNRFPQATLVQCVRDTISGVREPSVRNAAMDALVKQGEAALDSIFTLLEAENWELRLHGTVMLGNIRSPLAVDKLAPLLTDSEENVVHAAAESLGAIGEPRAVPFLVDVLKTQEFWSQYPTVVALGRIAHHSATEPLLDFLNDEMLAPAIVDALGSIGDPRALQPLLSLLEGGDDLFVPPQQVLKSLARILANAGEGFRPPATVQPAIVRAIQTALESENVDDRVAALLIAAWSADPALIPVVIPRLAFDAEQEAAHAALKAIGEAAGPSLVSLLDAPLPSVRRAAIRLLAEIKADLSPALQHIIDHDETVRMEVAFAVGISGNPALTEYLFEMLLDESEDVRRVALEVLSSFRTEKSVREQLYRRLEYYPDDHLPIIIETLGRVDVLDALPRLRLLIDEQHGEQVRAAVAKAVSAAGEDAAKEILLAAAGDPSPNVRCEALRGLSGLKGDDVFAEIAKHIEDPDVHCAYAAVTAFGALGMSHAIPLLERVAADSGRDMGIRVQAVASLGKLQAQAAAPALADLLAMRDEDVRREVTKALAYLQGPEVFQALIRASVDPFWAVRATAVAALAKHGAAGVEHVLRALEDPEPLVRKAAVRGLSAAGPSPALRLIPLLADDALEDVVAKTLESMGERILPHLANIPEHSDPTLRLRIARVLGKIRGGQAKELLLRLAGDAVPEVATVAQNALAEEKNS
jgi:HEAT repeat protein